MGYFKIETADVPICEVIALQPKLYSVLTAECGEHTNQSSCKLAAKGVYGKARRELKHAIFNQVHNQEIFEHRMDGCTIRARNHQLMTVKNNKRALASLDKKRWWYSSTRSFGFGHPDIPAKNNVRKTANNPISVKKARKKHRVDYVTDLTYNSSMPGRKMFFKNNPELPAAHASNNLNVNKR